MNNHFEPETSLRAGPFIIGPTSDSTAEEFNPLSTQEGGTHYKDLVIQPVEYIHHNGLGYCEGNVVKYITRYKARGGKQDLLKAKHYIELLIQMEYPES